MVRAAKKQKQNGDSSVAPELNPEAEERKRLKKLAFAKDVVSDVPPLRSSFSQLNPSKTVIKHHGKDIIKKSQRKNRFLFSFPGLLAPVTGGKIGELKDLGTKNPILYLDFPQGQMKLFGTIVFPKNRYLTLQFSRGGKNVMCDDYFDTMIVFSDAWWIGKKEENPDEACLEFPKELNEGQADEYDFKGGAGATSVTKKGLTKSGVTCVEEQSPKTELQEDFSEEDIISTPVMKTTPVRHSERTAGKRFKFTEVPSGGSSADSDADISEEDTKVGIELGSTTRNKRLSKTETLGSLDLGIGNKDAAVRTGHIELVPDSTAFVGIAKKTSESATLVTRQKEVSHSNQGSLVQATISSLFKKAGEKKKPRDSKKSHSPKGSHRKLELGDSKRKIDQADGSRKKAKLIEEKKAGSEITLQNKQSEDLNSAEPAKVYGRKKKPQSGTVAPVSLDDSASPEPPILSSQAEDDIEDFSSTSQDSAGSDDDWTA